MSDLKMTIPDLSAFLANDFPQLTGCFEMLSLEPMFLRSKFNVTEAHLRPGGTVSGPTMFTMADVSAYVIVLAMVGPKALSVTTSCAMDFMRKPAANTPLIAETRLLKLGRALAVTDALIYSEGAEQPVARANMTYAIPPS